MDNTDRIDAIIQEHRTLRTVILKALDLGYFLLENTDDIAEVMDILRKQFVLMEQLQQLNENAEAALERETHQ